VFNATATSATIDALIQNLTYAHAGDNPTASRTLTLTITDADGGAASGTYDVNVIPANDAPVNNGMTGTFSGGPFVEDAVTGAALSGISISDPDADPATQNLVFTFSVAHGSLTFLTNVTGGIVAADIIGGANGSGTVTISATQNEINATLGFTGGLRYVPTANFNGNDTLTLTSNDQGFSGIDPGNSGTGTTEADVDAKTIFVIAMNDAPTVPGDGTEAAAAILEDTPLTNGTAPTISTLFGGQFSDATDNQTAFGGSAAGILAGVAVVANGSSAATGQWQYLVGATWLNVGTVAQDNALMLAAGTRLRFNPAPDFNGTAPTLIVHLVDDSLGPVSSGTLWDLSGAGATGGATR